MLFHQRSGILHRPIEVGGLSIEEADKVLASRVQIFSKAVGESYLPVLASDFLDLYKILNFNLRSVLQEADEYCLSVSSGDHPVTDEQKTTSYRQWLQEEGKQLHDAVARQLTPRAWKVFEDAINIGGSFSPSDFETFGFNSIAAFRPSVKALEDVHLVTSVRDETDNRRKSTVITPNAFLVYHYRRNASNAEQSVQ